MPRRLVVLMGLLLGGLAGPVFAAPVSSDGGAAVNGGGCNPPASGAVGLDALAAENPPWAPVVKPHASMTRQVIVHGTVADAHGDRGGEFPATHVRGDVVAHVALDAADAGRRASADPGPFTIAWEADALPDWAWPSAGDRVVALGRWVFDCATPAAIPGTCSASATQACVIDDDCRPPACLTCNRTETCTGEHFGYRAELHPPDAIAVIRTGGGGALTNDDGAAAVPVTRADVYAGTNGGGAGDRCILTPQAHVDDLLTVGCFPLSQPVAQLNGKNFTFDMPLPPRPRHGRMRWRIVPHPLPSVGDVRPTVAIATVGGRAPRLRVRLQLKNLVGGAFPTGYAATIYAGWVNDPQPLTHVRVTIEDVIVQNPLRPGHPSVPRECTASGMPCSSPSECDPGEDCLGQGDVRSWRLQAAVNGVWQQLDRLDQVDVGILFPQSAVYDVWLPADGTLRIVADGAAEECREARVGRPLADGLVELGASKLLACLDTHARDPGRVDVSHPGPDFGAGTVYEARSVGGDGGFCSLTDVIPCVVDDDCPVGETCVATGGAFTLRYRVELP